jgi:hypothetical protein
MHRATGTISSPLDITNLRISLSCAQINSAINIPVTIPIGLGNETYIFHDILPPIIHGNVEINVTHNVPICISGDTAQISTRRNQQFYRTLQNAPHKLALGTQCRDPASCNVNVLAALSQSVVFLGITLSMGIQIPMLLKKHYALIFKGQHDYS